MRPQDTEKSISGSRRNCPNGHQATTLHRVREVMQRESISTRSLAGRLEMTQGEIARLVAPDNDLRISDLYRLQEVLGVPLSELLTEVELGLSKPVKVRAQLLRLMRTVHSIQENSNQERVVRMAQQMREELLKIMPELEDVAAWPQIGTRRTIKELGAIVDRCFPSGLFQHTPKEQTD